MKSIFSLAILACILVSCSNDFVLIEDKIEIPVVFGFLSLTDTAQYIRVERAFRDENISAFELAQRADSLYYTNAEVSITDLTTGTDYTLTRVNGELEGYPREAGAFAQSPNYLYKIRTEDIDLVAGRDYKITVRTNQDEVVASAETTLGGLPKLLNPEDGDVFDFSFITDVNIKWREDPYLKLYDVNFYLNIKERDISSPENEFIDKQLTWNIAKNVEDFKFTFEGVNFFNFLRANLDADPAIVRKFVDFEAELTGAGEELTEYINVITANNGITSSGEIPTYTNIENGYGLFSSRNKVRVTEIQLAPKTIDSLYNSTFTKELNFE
jgi:hypothetical protein